MLNLTEDEKKQIKRAFQPPASFQPSVKDKYGKGDAAQDYYLAQCFEGVELVANTVLDLKDKKSSEEVFKKQLESLLEKLGGIRHDIAKKNKTSVVSDEEVSLFGRIRYKDPVKEFGGVRADEKEGVVDMTSIESKQHGAAAQAIKKYLALYLAHIYKTHSENHKKDPEKYSGNLVFDATDKSGKTRYRVTVYPQKSIRFLDKTKNQKVQISIRKNRAEAMRCAIT